jgi:glycosyltransferase involved in cell wall biosynthesis
MKIALLAPFEEPVPPEKYGGTELVVYNLAETLVDLGHKVYLLASGDSNTRAELIKIFPRALRKEKYAFETKNRNDYGFIGVARALEILKYLKPDIVHNHFGWGFLPFQKEQPAPVVTTLHGTLEDGRQKHLHELFRKHPYISISNSQRKPCPEMNYVANVYNGIDIDKFEISKKRGNYLAFLGRICTDKGIEMAIDIAKATGRKLKIAAKIDIMDVPYYQKKIKKKIDGKQIEFLGEIGPEQKKHFLKNAYALLAPIQWEEPFGLFMAEAMASGVPVIANDRGSVRELIQDKETGFILHNRLEEFAEAVEKSVDISKERCREWVRQNFSMEVMTQNYLRVYERVIMTERIKSTMTKLVPQEVSFRKKRE